MTLYICYGRFSSPRPGGHPCKNAADALEAAGHRPKLVRAYGLGILPRWFNLTPGRRRVKQLTGNYWVPTLELDDGAVIDGSENIIAWAKANPA